MTSDFARLAARLLEKVRTDLPGIPISVGALLRARILFLACDRGAGVRAYGRVLVGAVGRLRIGDRVSFVGGPVPTELRSGPDALLEIGDESVLNYGVSIESHQSVRMGARCLLGSYVRLCDRGRDRVAPITIGDDVWLAHGAIVEPGVTIGEGSVIAAGSVVTKDVPPRSLAMGNPARNMSLGLAGPRAPAGA